MRHFRFILCLFAVVALGACTSEPANDMPDEIIELMAGFTPVENGVEVHGDVDVNVFRRYEGAIEDATYNCVYQQLYRKDDLTHGKWERDNGVYEGMVYIVPSEIVVLNGKIWKPVETFSLVSGPTAFGTALNAVNVKLRKDYSAYVGYPFAFSAENSTLSYCGFNFGVAKADDETILLSYESQYLGGRTKKGGSQLEFGFYCKTEPLDFNKNKELAFATVVEAYDWLIELFQETFGEKVNLNNIVGAILDQPYFYLSTLKAERDRFAQAEE